MDYTDNMNSSGKQATRLSDRVLFALELALEQGDLDIAESLTRALEMAMTRNTGGGEFVERRDYPADMEAAMKKLVELRSRNSF